jgi:hypothetical protein
VDFSESYEIGKITTSFRDVIHVDTWLRKEVVILPILSLYTQQDAFTQGKESYECDHYCSGGRNCLFDGLGGKRRQTFHFDNNKGFFYQLNNSLVPEEEPWNRNVHNI